MMATARKKSQRAGPWPTSVADTMSGVTTARSQSMLAGNGAPAASPITIHRPSVIVPSQHIPIQQANGSRQNLPTAGEGVPVLYLLSMNGTFERKTITVPYEPDSLRIGRQTNAKTLPTPTNGFFDSKVLSRQHAEIYADRNGQIWIRDVKSSNGTFINGARLSPENRDSDPKPLNTQDHLELGIDIVSEDQKTVVHHKVAAKVEHAGFLGATNNVLDMNFGDLDPANGIMMLPSQGPMQMRSRAGSQGSMASNGRMVPPSNASGGQMSLMGQQRPMNFWLTPVTTEQIVKKLMHEMRVARLQSNDLGRADHFFGALLTKENIQEVDKSSNGENKAQHMNSGSLALRTEAKTRFSDPPAPPPQQPLPEKPDMTRSHPFDVSSPSPLKRSNTEKARPAVNGSPIRQESTSQILSLVEALASAKKELDLQSARMHDLEELLQQERQARQLAEEVAKRLETQPLLPITNGHAIDGADLSILEKAFEPSLEVPTAKEREIAQEVDTESISASTLLLEQGLEKMAIEMQTMKKHMEAFKLRAEVAEAERDNSRITLAQMAEKIRLNEEAQRLSADGRRSSLGGLPTTTALVNGQMNPLKGRLGEKDCLSNLAVTTSQEDGKLDQHQIGTLSRPPGGHDPILYHTGPYASMIGVVLIGMGLMAYLNGWQPPKADR